MKLIVRIFFSTFLLLSSFACYREKNYHVSLHNLTELEITYGFKCSVDKTLKTINPTTTSSFKIMRPQQIAIFAEPLICHGVESYIDSSITKSYNKGHVIGFDGMSDDTTHFFVTYQEVDSNNIPKFQIEVQAD